MKVYEGWENVRRTFPSSKLILVQCDSLTFTITLKRNELYQRIKIEVSDKLPFDFSSIPRDSPLYSTEFACKPGFWKLEGADDPITEVISIRPKLFKKVRASSHLSNDSDRISYLRDIIDKYKRSFVSGVIDETPVDLTRILCDDGVSTRPYS